MIRGTHNSREWYELITLGGDSDEQAKEWLSLLGTTPVPPMRPQSPSGRPQFMDMTPSRKEAEVPIGARKLQKPAPTSPRKYSATVEDDADSSRFRGSLPGSHPRGSPLPCTPDQRSPPVSYGATQPQYGGGDAHIIQLQGEAGSSELSKLRKQLPNSSSFRADGAPPPPVHRTFGPKRMDITPVAKPQRRNSSPLKHEYRPDEQSSSGTDTASITSSSTDDSDAVLDLPETLPGISIKHGLHESPPTSVSSRTPSNETSDSSLAPSNSASQASPLTNIPAKQPDGTVTLVASVSHWSNRKGGYRDLEGKAWNENVPSEPYSIVITPGLLEVFPLGSPSYQSYGQALQASGDSDISENAEMLNGTVRPLIALDLTPLVMIRQSNLTDVEIRSHVRSYSKYNKIDSGIFRFRSPSIQESQLMYQAVHTSRMNNRKYKLLEEQNRIRNFGQNALQDALKTDSAGGDDTSSRRRSFFGFGRRGGSYRASARGPASTSNHQTAQSSHGGSTSMSSSYSASSFLRRLMGGGDGTFDITGSTVQRMAGLPTDLESSTYEGEAKHLYDADSGFKIKCFMMVGVNKWEDYGPCELWITKPEPGMHQASNIYHGMQKRITVTRTIQTTPIAKAVASVAATVFRDTAVAGAALTAYGEGHKITRGVASATIGRPGGPLDNEKGRTSETNNTATAESPRKPQSHDVHAAAAALGREVVMDFVVGSDNFTRIGTRGICLNVWEDIYHPELGVGRVPAKGGVAGTVKKWMFACSSTDQANFIYKRLVTEVEGVIG